MRVLIVSPWVPQYRPSSFGDGASAATVVRPWENTAGGRFDLVLYEGLPADRRDELIGVLNTCLRPGGRLQEMS